MLSTGNHPAHRVPTVLLNRSFTRQEPKAGVMTRASHTVDEGNRLPLDSLQGLTGMASCHPKSLRELARFYIPFVKCDAEAQRS